MALEFGFLAALGAAIFNGSFVAPFKTDRIISLRLKPMIFQLYVSMGVFISSLIAIPFLSYNSNITDDDNSGTSFQFSWLAMVGGMLFVFATCSSFIAVELIGLALAQGIWGGVAILVSFSWGIVGFGQYPKSPVLSALGLVVLCVGIAGIALCNEIHAYVYGLSDGNSFSLPNNKNSADTTVTNPISFPSESITNSERSSDSSISPIRASFNIDYEGGALKSVDLEDVDSMSNSSCKSSSEVASDSSIPISDCSRPSTRGSVIASPYVEPIRKVSSVSSIGSMLGLSEGAKKAVDWYAGVSWAVMVGLAGGSVLVPLYYVPSSQAGLVFLPSFGAGAMLTSPVLFGLSCLRTGEIPSFHIQSAMLAGIFSGFLWNLSNVCSIIAIPILGYGIAYPIMQCALFVAGMWGIFVFKEMTGGTVRIFFLSGLVLLVGAVLLSLGQYISA